MFPNVVRRMLSADPRSVNCPVKGLLSQRSWGSPWDFLEHDHPWSVACSKKSVKQKSVICSEKFSLTSKLNCFGGVLTETS